MQVLEFASESVHPALQFIDVDILVAFDVFEGLLEVLAEFLGHDVDVSAGGVVEHGIGPDLADIVGELEHVLVKAFFELSLDGGEVHRFFDDVEVVRDVEGIRVDCLLEGSCVLVFAQKA